MLIQSRWVKLRFLFLALLHLITFALFHACITGQFAGEVIFIWFLRAIILLHIIELAIQIIKQVLNGQEHHFPVMDWVVIVFAKYSARYLELVRCPRENIEVRWEVIVLNLQRLFQIIDLEILEQGDSFSDTVLQLQVVDENNLFLETRLRF